MTYTDFQSVLNRDKEKARYFLQPDSAPSWLNTINNTVADWIKTKKGGQGLWEVVRFVSIRRGVISKSLSRENFAKMLLAFCPEKFEKDQTGKKIMTSMSHCKYRDILKKFEMLGDNEEIKEIVSQIEAFFNGEETILASQHSDPTVLDRLETFLHSLTDSDTTKFPCLVVKIKPDYGDDITPTIALEEYKKKEFYNLNKPSKIEAYEIISDNLTIDVLRSFLGKYEGRRNIKLYIVSTKGLSNDVYSLAGKKDVGYVRINPKKEMTNASYELPRSVEDYSRDAHMMDMLFDRTTMDVPMVIWDGERVNTSLADVLKSDNFSISSKHILRAPILAYKEIECKAEELAIEYIQRCNELSYNLSKDILFIETPIYGNVRKNGRSYVQKAFKRNYIDLSVDPFTIAEHIGLRHEVSDLPSGQLGHIDLRTGTIVLDRSGFSNYDRYRFTMAHEVGHYILHSSLLEKQGIHSLGESENTVSENQQMIIGSEEIGWLERQANHFAASLLMPVDMVNTLYTYLYKWFVTDVYGYPLAPLYYNPKQRETWDAYNEVVGGSSKILNVSLAAMHYRLLELKLLKTDE